MDCGRIRTYIIATCMVFTCVLVAITYFATGPKGVKRKSSPNIILVITDDQDLLLNGMEPMTFTRKFFEDGGVTFKNAFVSTPVCCPSRASILTGRYQHNTGVVNNTEEGDCCGTTWRRRTERHSVATYLKRRGYTTFYAGKYLNKYGFDSAGGVGHVPPGWDWWVGLVGNSRYYNYTLSVNGTARTHGDDYAEDYLTDVIKRYALEFLRGRTADGGPFFLTLAPPAPHSPQTPAPQHRHLFPAVGAPRTASYNVRAEDKHALLREEPAPLPPAVLDAMDAAYRDRWRTLVSVDEMVAAVVAQLRQRRLMDDTYLLFTSDHGYHLGQFSLTVDKRQPYEFDLRVPLYVRGGRLPAGRAVRAPVTVVDLAPTLLELASLPPADAMDGVSLLETAAAEIGSARPLASRSRPEPRSALLVSYTGEYNMAVDPGCAYRGRNVSHCYEQYACKCQDSEDNTYQCIREMTGSANQIVCLFTKGEEFWEMYDLSADPDQLVNLAPRLSVGQKARWKQRLATATRCRGPSCRHI